MFYNIKIISATSLCINILSKGLIEKIKINEFFFGQYKNSAYLCHVFEAKRNKLLILFNLKRK